MREQLNYVPGESEAQSTPEGEIKRPVDVEKMYGSVRSSLERDLKDPEQIEQAFSRIKTALETSGTLEEFREKFFKLYDWQGYANRLGTRGRVREVPWDHALSNLSLGIVPLFGIYFADKQGYVDMEKYLREKHNAEYID